MASRRVRIKGIANIPQRRKPLNDTSENETEAQNNAESNKLQEVTEKLNLNETFDTHGNTSDVILEGNGNNNDNDSHVKKSITNTLASDVLIETEFNATDKKLDPFVTKPVPHSKSDVGFPEVNSEENHIVLNNTDKGQDVKVKKIITDKVPIRRKFLKPPIRISVLNRKAKETHEEIKTEPNKENLQESVNINLNEIEISANSTNSSVFIQKAEQRVEPVAPKLDVPKILSKESAVSGSDTEYQHPPTSPTKLLNRRIKAIPRLHQRRTSFSIGSASESEDDSRRSYGRIRNDSVCSVASGVNESHSANEAVSPTRKELQPVQRKCRKTEQTRKFAEARREFNMKFNNGKPDKQKLTMIDLIFYNPATSPMSSNKRKRKSTSSSEINESTSTKSDKPEEEKVDDPQPLSESDDDDEIPAPQIKVGPNGEIVVDEKSLVIENAETKKGREALQMSELVNGDEDTSYGVYKRIKRSKDWAKEETLRFYKALNTIGTDFTMMCELFPNRTRRELKMKFKKEERHNRLLIDRAVMQPIQFDMTELRRDLELAERKAEESKRRAEETKIIRATTSEQKKHLKKIERIKGIDTNPDGFAKATQVTKEPVKKRKKTALEAIKSGINGISSDSDDDVHESGLPSPVDYTVEDNDVASENGDQEDVANILKPTRYGRIPKARSRALSDCLVRKTIKKRKRSLSEKNKCNSNLEPGSIMIVKSKTPSDEVMYKVYIVTDNQTKQQIRLEPNVLENLTDTGIDHQDKNGSSANADLSRVSITTSHSSNYSNEIKIIGDSIVFPFDECLTHTGPNQNITVSHEDNKMIVITEDNKKCVLSA